MADARKRWSRLGHRRKLALVLAVLALVSVVGYGGLIRPKQAEAKALDARLAELEAELVLRTSDSAAAAQAPAIRAADLFRLAKAMPDRADMPGVLLQLNDVAAEAGIVFKSIIPGVPSPREGYQVLPVELQFEGDFYGLSDFLYRLRNLVQVRDGGLDARGRLFTVQSLAYAESERKFPRILASLTVNAFVYGTEASAPMPTAPPAQTETTPPVEATG
ncbi:MAG: type 4a pilus biogenesis protein PilO [Gaiellaceae bacterium]